MCLKNPEDWLNDDHDGFENKGYYGSIVTMNSEEVVFVERMPRIKGKFLRKGSILSKQRTGLTGSTKILSEILLR